MGFVRTVEAFSLAVASSLRQFARLISIRAMERNALAKYRSGLDTQVAGGSVALTAESPLEAAHVRGGKTSTLRQQGQETPPVVAEKRTAHPYCCLIGQVRAAR